MNPIRHISEIDRINKLYKDHDMACAENVIAFSSLPNPNIMGLLDDVEALLSDPNTRQFTESILRSSLKHIAETFVGPHKPE